VLSNKRAAAATAAAAAGRSACDADMSTSTLDRDGSSTLQHQLTRVPTGSGDQLT